MKTRSVWILFCTLVLQAVAQTTYTWTNTVGGAKNWIDGANWLGGAEPIPVSGDTVDFSTVNIAASTTVTLGADRTAESWKFGDTNNGQDWTVAAGNKIILAGTTPTINVVNRIATLNNILDGTAGLIKTGGGQLALAANNTYSGSTTVSEGMLNLGAITLSGFGSGRDILVAAGAAIRRNILDNAFLNRLVETTGEITVMTGTTGNNLDFGSSTGANLPNAFLGNWASNGAKMTYTGILTPASDNYRLGGKHSAGLLGISGDNKLTGSQGLIVGGTGASGIRVELAGAQNFTGDTVISAGARLSLGNNLALQNSTLDLGADGGNFSLAAGTNGGRITGETATPSPTLGGLKGSRNLLTVFSAIGGNNETLLAATAVTGFTLNLAAGKTNTYSGAIANFAAGTTVTKTGAGTQIFANTNTYTGTTFINAGTLALGANDILPGAPISIGDGTLDMVTFSDTVGTLEVTGSTGTINLGTGATLAFADSSSVTWSGSKLMITGDFVAGSSIKFGITSSGLTPVQLTKISVVGGGYAKLDDNGFLKTYKGTIIQAF